MDPAHPAPTPPLIPPGYTFGSVTDKISAEEGDRRIADGDVKTACQQACPADAIVFGDLNDASSQVVKLKSQDRNYGLLEDLGTRPRTSYLAVVRNPNEALKS